jgi:hypothetical protein
MLMRCVLGRYDRHVYFFDVRGEAPKLLVMSNFEEAFNVMSSSVVMTLETNRDKLNAVLDLIPKVGIRLCSRILWGATGARRSKRDMCADIGALLLIDDNLQYAGGV